MSGLDLTPGAIRSLRERRQGVSQATRVTPKAEPRDAGRHGGRPDRNLATDIAIKFGASHSASGLEKILDDLDERLAFGLWQRASFEADNRPALRV